MSIPVKQLQLSSINSTNKSHSNPNFVITPPLQFNGNLKVKSVNIPLTSYNIDQYNNTLKVYEKITSGGVTQNNLITIPVGNYNSSNFLTALQTGLNSAGSLYYSCTFSTFSNLLTITQSTGSFGLMTYTNSVYNELGVFDSSLNITSNSTLITDAPLDLSGIKVLNICSNIPTDNSGLSQYNVLCSVPIEESTNTLSLFQDDSSDYISTGLDNLNYINLELRDSLFRKINQKNNWSLVLNCEEEQ